MSGSRNPARVGGTGGIEQLLLLQPRWMGDVLLCTPAIRAARRAFPVARIVFVTEGAGGEVLRHNPDLDEVWIDEGSVRSRLALLRRVARARFDAVVDFRSTGSTAQLALLSRAPIRIGIRGRGPRNRIYSTLVPRLAPPHYAARHKLEMLTALGIDPALSGDLSLTLPIGAAAREAAERVWRERGLHGERVVAISPASREAYKQWGTERWAAVADRLLEAGARILITHGPGEAEQVGRVLQAMRRRSDAPLAPRSLEEVAALFERADFWVGNDGGAKHLAAAAGIPTFAISRWEIGPVWTDPEAPARQLYLERTPTIACDRVCPRCTHRSCLTSLPVEQLLEAIGPALQGAES